MTYMNRPETLGQRVVISRYSRYIKALVVAPRFYPDHDPEAIVCTNLVRAFVRSGFEVTVTSGAAARTYSTLTACEIEGGAAWASVRRYRLLGWVTTIVGADRWENIHHFKQVSKSKTITEMCASVLDQHDVSVIVSFTAYAHLAVLRALRQRERQIPWVAVWNDPFPGKKYPVPYGKGPKASVLPSQARLIDEVSTGASWHVFAADRLRRYMLEYFPRRVETNSSVVPHVLLNDHIIEEPATYGTFVLGYAGAWGPERRPEVFCRGLQMLKRGRDVGGVLKIHYYGNDGCYLRRLAERLGVSECFEFKGRLPNKRCLRELGRCAAVLLVEAPLDEGVFLPSKLVDYAATGRPILAVCPSQGTVADLIAKRGGLLADCTRPEAIAKAIEELYLLWRDDRLEDFSSRGLREEFGEMAVVRQYLDIFRKVGVHMDM